MKQYVIDYKKFYITFMRIKNSKPQQECYVLAERKDTEEKDGESKSQ